MDFWQYIEVLRGPNKAWFFSKDNTQEKINALMKIANEGYPSLISGLIEFLKDNNKDIREATCKTIIHLFKKIDSKNGYYDTLKHCSISKSDIDFYEVVFPKEQFFELLTISSLNESGYVREKAVIKLTQTQNPKAIQFLVYRLADWVSPVRQAALKGIETYKMEQYIDGLIENLPIFEWLQKVERTDLSGIYQNIIEFIAIGNREYIITNFKKYPDKTRLLLAKHISSYVNDYSRELKLFLNDKNFSIRNLVINHFDKLGKNEVDQLLNDKSAKVRLQTLYCIKDQNEFSSTIKKYLSDNSAAIRYFARFTIKQENADFADMYNQNLLVGSQIIGSLNGLAEVEARQYSETVKKYLNDKKIKIRKTAFLALQKLDEENAFRYAFVNLDTSLVGLRNLIIDLLSATPTQEVLTKAREIYQNSNFGLKKSMLRLFYKIGGWAAVPDLIIGTIDEDENIRQLALGYLQIWRIKAVRLFSTPKQEEIERAMQVFQFAHEIHDAKQYFRTNPLNGIDFYFK